MAASDDGDRIQSLESAVERLESAVEKLQTENRDLRARQTLPAMHASQSPGGAQASQSGSEASAGKGQVKVGTATVSLGGFLDSTVYWRDHNALTDYAVASQLPFGNVANYHGDEIRGSARYTRMIVKAENDPGAGNHIVGLVEWDFLGAAPTASSRGTNSWNPRLRLAYAGVDWGSSGWHLYSGQTYGLMNPYKTARLIPGNETGPINQDPAAVVGYESPRQWTLRVIKDLAPNASVALAVENPQGNWGGSTSASGVVATPVSGGAVVTTMTGNSGQFANTLSLDQAPDVVLKAGYDIGSAVHFEAYGMARFFHDQQTTGGGHDAVGGGGGVASILRVIPDLEVTASASYGALGRYTTNGGMADVTFDRNGRPVPINALHTWIGAVHHTAPSLDLYAYGGVEQQLKTAASDFGAQHYGYGNPYNAATSALGCSTIGGSCTGDNHRLWEVTVGSWYNLYSGNYGKFTFGPELLYERRDLFPNSVGYVAHTHSLSAIFSMRYYPF